MAGKRERLASAIRSGKCKKKIKKKTWKKRKEKEQLWDKRFNFVSFLQFVVVSTHQPSTANKKNKIKERHTVVCLDLKSCPDFVLLINMTQQHD